MGFWIFMLIMVLSMPILMILFGSIFIKRAPKNINYLFGYRTSMSMKNKDTWCFAHALLGKLWLICGLCLAALFTVPMLFVINCGKDTVGVLGEILTLVGVFIMILTIIPVEAALKRTFDKNGNRKSPEN